MRTRGTHVRQYLEKIRSQAKEAHLLAYDPRLSQEERAGYRSTYAILSLVVDGLQHALKLDEEAHHGKA